MIFYYKSNDLSACCSFFYEINLNCQQKFLVPRGDSCAVQGAGNDRATRLVNTQAEAIQIAREHASNQGSELRIHRPNGQIREGRSYGNDPYPPKG
ncbi:MAG: DUF2188 domain-containing protein [Bacteroidota bacterium]